MNECNTCGGGSGSGERASTASARAGLASSKPTFGLSSDGGLVGASPRGPHTHEHAQVGSGRSTWPTPAGAVQRRTGGFRGRRPIQGAEAAPNPGLLPTQRRHHVRVHRQLVRHRSGQESLERGICLRAVQLPRGPVGSGEIVEEREPVIRGGDLAEPGVAGRHLLPGPRGRLRHGDHGDRQGGGVVEDDARRPPATASRFVAGRWMLPVGHVRAPRGTPQRSR